MRVLQGSNLILSQPLPVTPTLPLDLAAAIQKALQYKLAHSVIFSGTLTQYEGMD